MLWRGLGLGGVKKANSQTVPFIPSCLIQDGVGSEGPWEGKVTSEGVAGLQAIEKPGGKEGCSYVSGGRLIAWSDCVGIRVIFFHLGQDVWCVVFFSRRGPHFCYGDDRFHSSGSCSQLPGDLPVDFLLPGRAQWL